MTNRIFATAQELEPGGSIALFSLDCRSIGGQILHFCQGSESTEPVKFGGVEYTPVDCEFEGLETSGQGALPTPLIRVANMDSWAQEAVNTYGDLLDCELIRIRTFVRHLDGHSDADEESYFGPDVFRIERKNAENPLYIEWELSASIDQEGKQIPGRTVVRNTCLARYRSYKGDGTFDYRKAQCPYTGDDYFDENDKPTNAAGDKPSRTLTCCEKRFGKGKPLPTWAFPGAARGQ